MDRCGVCGSDDLIEYSNGTKCQRCESMGGDAGWEYNPDEVQERINHYDEFHGE